MSPAQRPAACAWAAPSRSGIEELQLLRIRRPFLATLSIAVLSAAVSGAIAAMAQPADEPNLFDAQARSAAADASRYKLRSSIPPKYGNPPAFGAGASGFDSTNARKKKKQKLKQKPAIEAKALPPLPVRPVDTTLAAVYQQQPNAASRYARRG